MEAYREILRDIPAMRENFTIIEDEPYVRRVIRAQFDKNSSVSDPKIIDMLVFKARQEAGEIRNQWKSRYHVYKHITNYREEQRVLADIARDDDIEDVAHTRRDRLLSDWKAKGLIPSEIESWKAFQHWRKEEDTKFNAFAQENQLFTSEQIERNDKAKAAMCTIV